MSERITVVAGCTSAKSSEPLAGCRARDLPSLPIEERCLEWTRRLRASPSVGPARTLYRGQHWARVIDALRAFERLGFEVEPLVASAGLGLIGFDAPAPSYSATFARGEDGIWRGEALDGRRDSSQRSWWSHLRKSMGSQAHPNGDTVVTACSPAYLSAMEPDLDDWIAEGRNVILLSTGYGSERSVAFDRRLARVVPCGMSAINGAALLLAVETAERHQWDLAQLRATFAEALANVPRAGSARRRVTDAELRQAICDARAEEPGASPTRVLKKVRDSGIACEQSRFRGMFQETASLQHGG